MAALEKLKRTRDYQVGAINYEVKKTVRNFFNLRIFTDERC